MKYLITFIILFHSFGNGYSMIGYAIPGVTSMAYDSNGLCTKYEGYSLDCTPDDRFFMNYLFALEEYKIAGTTTIIKD